MDYASTLLQLLPSARRLPGLRELLNSVEAYLPPEQVADAEEAAGGAGRVRCGGHGECPSQSGGRRESC